MITRGKAFVARMQSAEEFFAEECRERAGRATKTEHADYMDFAERYADYVVAHEKFIARTGLEVVEALENATV